MMDGIISAGLCPSVQQVAGPACCNEGNDGDDYGDDDNDDNNSISWLSYFNSAVTVTGRSASTPLLRGTTSDVP